MTMSRLLPGMCHHRVYSVRDDHWGALHPSRHALLLERCRGILVPLSTADEISYGYIVSLVVGFVRYRDNVSTRTKTLCDPSSPTSFGSANAPAVPCCARRLPPRGSPESPRSGSTPLRLLTCAGCIR